MGHDSRHLVFLELVDEAQAFLESVRSGNFSLADCAIVALSIEVQHFLNQEGVPFQDTVELFNRDDHVHVLTQRDTLTNEFERILDLRVDGEIIQDTYQDTASFFIQYFIGYFLFFVAIVRNAIECHSPDAVIVFKGPETQVKRRSVDWVPRFRVGEGLASRIVEAYARQLGIDVVAVTRGVSSVADHADTSMGDERESVRKRILKWGYRKIAKRMRRRHLVLFAGGGGTNGLSIIAAVGKVPSALTLVFDYEPLAFRRLAVSLLRSIGSWSPYLAIPVDAFDSRESKSSVDHLFLLEGRLENAFREPPNEMFTECGVGFFSIFGQRIDELFHYLRDVIGERVAKEIEVLRHTTPRQVIATSAREGNYALAEWSRWAGSEFVMVSHGTVIAPKNELEDIENRRLGRSLLLSKVVSAGMLQSRIEEAHVNHYKPACRIVATGPIVFADLDRKGRRRPRDKKVGPPVITVASSFKTSSSLTFWAMETPDEYLLSCRDIVRAVNDLDQDVELCIRFHAKLGMHPDSFRELLPECSRLRIDRGGRFLECLRRTDLIVNFSSTSIEESLQNRVPVLLYDRWARYRHCDASLIEDPDAIETSAVYYLNKPAYLSAALASITDRLGTIRETPDLFDPYCFPDSYISNFTDFISEASNVEN